MNSIAQKIWGAAAIELINDFLFFIIYDRNLKMRFPLLRNCSSFFELCRDQNSSALSTSDNCSSSSEKDE